MTFFYATCTYQPSHLYCSYLCTDVSHIRCCDRLHCWTWNHGFDGWLLVSLVPHLAPYSWLQDCRRNVRCFPTFLAPRPIANPLYLSPVSLKIMEEATTSSPKSGTMVMLQEGIKSVVYWVLGSFSLFCKIWGSACNLDALSEFCQVRFSYHVVRSKIFHLLPTA